MSEILDKIAKLQKLDEERKDLLDRLMRSVIIKEIYPRAFKYGKVKTYIKGNPSQGFTLVIKRGNGTYKEWPVADAPKALVYTPLENIGEHFLSQGDIRAADKINKLLEKL